MLKIKQKKVLARDLQVSDLVTDGRRIFLIVSIEPFGKNVISGKSFCLNDMTWVISWIMSLDEEIAKVVG